MLKNGLRKPLGPCTCAQSTKRIFVRRKPVKHWPTVPARTRGGAEIFWFPAGIDSLRKTDGVGHHGQDEAGRDPTGPHERARTYVFDA